MSVGDDVALGSPIVDGFLRCGGWLLVMAAPGIQWGGLDVVC